MKKTLLKLASLALCITTATTMLAACGKGTGDGAAAATPITATHLSFKTAPVGYAVENPLANPGQNVVYENNKVKVTVPTDTTAVVLNLYEFFKNNEGLLGANTSFTRSDRVGTGYVYNLVGPDTSVTANRKWVKYGEDPNVAANVKLHSDWAATSPERTGLVMWNFKTGTQENNNRVEIIFFATRRADYTADASKHFGEVGAVREFTLNIKGHNNTEHKLQLVIDIAE